MNDSKPDRLSEQIGKLIAATICMLGLMVVVALVTKFILIVLEL